MPFEKLKRYILVVVDIVEVKFAFPDDFIGIDDFSRKGMFFDAIFCD